jgi:YD repeat-containing protein
MSTMPINAIERAGARYSAIGQPDSISRLTRCIEVGAIHYVLLLAAAVLFFVPVPSFADGCTTTSHVDEQWGPPTYAQWIVTTGSCTSGEVARQACVSFVEQLGFSASGTCGSGDNGVGLVYEAGWFNGPLVYPNQYFGLFYYPQYFVSVYPQSQCDICVGDPVNPASGAVFLSEADAKEQPDNSLTFKRFYNSIRPGESNVSTGWRHSFSRSVSPTYSAGLYKAYQKSDPNNSSLYDDEIAACTNGFAQVKGRVAGWVDATSNYANGLCNVMANGATVGVVRIYSTTDAPFDGPVITSMNAIRDDGELIGFSVIGTSIVAPPNVDMTLQQTNSGYILIDANDSVETYDANGKLLTVATRTGVVQTMSYDASDRLSSVSDTFGHQLTLSYDGQNRLISVTRQ